MARVRTTRAELEETMRCLILEAEANEAVSKALLRQAGENRTRAAKIMARLRRSAQRVPACATAATRS